MVTVSLCLGYWSHILTVTKDEFLVLLRLWADTGNRQWTDESWCLRGSPLTVSSCLGQIWELFFWEPQHQTNLLSVWAASSADDWWRDIRLCVVVII